MLGMWWHSLNTAGRQKIASYQAEGRIGGMTENG